GIADARVVHQNVDTAEVALHRFDQHARIMLDGNVGLYRERFHSGTLDLRAHRRGILRFGLTRIVDDDLRALACECDGDTAPDTRAGTRDKRDLVLQLAHREDLLQRRVE